MTGLPRNAGSSNRSTSTKKASMSTCAIDSRYPPTLGRYREAFSERDHLSTIRSMWFRKSRRRTSRRAHKAGRIHLVRHGEVENPDDVVYAGISGFHLSDRGRAQAAEVANRLGDLEIGRILSSPLERATETAAAIAATHVIDVEEDERLTEWGLASRWQGVRWDDVNQTFPGELDAYLSNPTDLAFSPESLSALAKRVTEAIQQFRADTPGGDIVVVGHQDPLHAARLVLTGRSFEAFHDPKPGHESVTTLVSSIGSDSSNDPDWLEATYWEPDQGVSFDTVVR